MWKLEAKRFWWEFCYQVSFLWYKHGSYKWQRRAQYWKALLDHIKRQRKKQREPYRGFESFSAFIRHRDKHICYLCFEYIEYGESNIEHDLPVVRMGFTTEENCHDSHDRCNQEKFTMTAAEYRAWKAKGSKENRILS